MISAGRKIAETKINPLVNEALISVKEEITPQIERLKELSLIETIPLAMYILAFILVGIVPSVDNLPKADTEVLDEMKSIKGDETLTFEDDADILLKKFRKDKYIVAPEACGFNEQYLIQGGKNLEVREEQLEVAEDASVAQLARAFKKFSSGKLEKRKLLSRFIDMVAA
jgi:hypothetical protein